MILLRLSLYISFRAKVRMSNNNFIRPQVSHETHLKLMTLVGHHSKDFDVMLTEILNHYQKIMKKYGVKKL